MLSHLLKGEIPILIELLQACMIQVYELMVLAVTVAPRIIHPEVVPIIDKPETQRLLSLTNDAYAAIY